MTTETITHHPSDETLAAYAAGTLDRARGLVVAMHIAHCQSCSRQVGVFEAVGGSLLDSAPGTSMRPGALETALRRIEKHEAAELETAADPLASYALGPWRWVGPGVYRRAVDVSESEGIKVFMLKAAPGTKLPHHRHTGYEWTCVLEGAFEHQFGRFGPGDFDEADETMEHKPTVCEGVPCICIVALQGGIELQSRLGRFLQPLIRL
jgi:putative transcriptional regulator